MPEEAEENQKGKVRLIEEISGRPVAIDVEKPELPSVRYEKDPGSRHD